LHRAKLLAGPGRKSLPEHFLRERACKDYDRA
jgi:hypothetical protein